MPLFFTSFNSKYEYRNSKISSVSLYWMTSLISFLSVPLQHELLDDDCGETVFDIEATGVLSGVGVGRGEQCWDVCTGCCEGLTRSPL